MEEAHQIPPETAGELRPERLAERQEKRLTRRDLFRKVVASVPVIVVLTTRKAMAQGSTGSGGSPTP